MKWKKILITGASSGLGWAFALQMARPGITLFLTGRNAERLSQLRNLVQAKGAVAHTYQADLGSEEGVNQLLGLIDAQAPDLLVHNAGIGAYGEFVQTPLKRSLEIMQVNVMAIITLTNAWCRAILSRSMKGKILFISSIAGLIPTPGMTTYGASKACLNSFAEGLRFELLGSGISVLTVCPAHFSTNFQRRAAGKILKEPPSKAADAVAKNILRIIDREGVYIPFTWRVLFAIAQLVPRRWLMRQLERQILANVQSTVGDPCH
jgi:short-subunit dehydrogenase